MSGVKGRSGVYKRSKEQLEILINNNKKNPYWTGKKRSIKDREKMSKAKIGKTGKDTNHWKGGLTSESMRIRKSIEYRLWRESVFKRDGYTCIWCGKKGGTLHADHIKPFSLYPELRFAIDNGRTLCIDCHKKTDTYLSNCYKIKNKLPKK